MKNYKYNEFVYAEIIYNKGFQTKHIPTELRLLVLYYRDVLGYKPKEREEKIYDFCKNNIPNFKKEKFFKSINKALRAASDKRQKLVTIKGIDVFKAEIDYINNLDIQYEYKKVMFAFLVQMKLNKIVCEGKYNKEYNSIYFKGGTKKYNNIKKMANIPDKMFINDEVINKLEELKLITILFKGAILLNFINNCIQNDDIVFTITDFENVGLYLDYYNGVKGVKKCEGGCGYIIKMKNNKQKYCDDCAKEIKIQQDKLADKKYKEKLKSEKIENLDEGHK